jgi:hypothetical protein
MLRQIIIKKQPLKTFMNQPNLDMFPMVERRDFKTIDVEMSLNDGDILITCSIIRYMGQ